MKVDPSAHRLTDGQAARHGTGGVMLANKTRVLLILPRDLLDRARVLAGKATVALRLPVSLQIVLRALIGEGLKRTDDPALLANVEGQANAVRQIRSAGRQGVGAQEKGGDRAPESGDGRAVVRQRRRT
jgi:hypothetical protein